MQYTFSTNTWSFAKEQYEFIGEDNVSSTGNLADKIDLFGWSGSKCVAQWGISTSTDYSDYYGSFVDWGENIGDGNTWFTLSVYEWDYLISGRTNASNLKGVAKIDLGNGEYANGLILLPDNWQGVVGITFKPGFAAENSVEVYGQYQTFTKFEWKRLESAGAVFLPASGFRNGSGVYSVGHNGYYWSSTKYDSDLADYLGFYSDEACARWNCYRYYGGLFVWL